jgi:hypothetical protein
VLGVNDNPTYRYYLPLVTWAWKYFGWEVIVMNAKNYNTGYPSAMVAQVSRLYAALLVEPDSYLMTSDVDMLPLFDYWKIHPMVITSWGHDLTGYKHYPICYIGATREKWMEIMDIPEGAKINDMVKQDLDLMPQARCGDPIKEWVVDQDLITEKINRSGLFVNRVDRGSLANGYPVGRVDRSAWSLDGHNPFIDAHLFHNPDKGQKEKIKELLERVFPFENLAHYVS